ncbi:hypothetical protein KR50_12930 [Jeotgalibacillus campisalis]|uniref:Uncharacterized protein n=1 Tax=Jeotgalibacillus campisalis TaxID=220754 RepID=A0A0C2VXK7_9BACL|nr:hypothetical protein KR50_12930 [Jeotgalibacillus campisalis]
MRKGPIIAVKKLRKYSNPAASRSSEVEDCIKSLLLYVYGFIA